MHLAMIQEKKKNFNFIDYPGLEHNYFKVNDKGGGIPDNVGWNNTAKDWKAWLEKNLAGEELIWVLRFKQYGF